MGGLLISIKKYGKMFPNNELMLLGSIVVRYTIRQLYDNMFYKNVLILLRFIVVRNTICQKIWENVL